MNVSYSVVVKADASEIVVNVVNKNIDLQMASLGFVYDANLSRYVRLVADNREKAKVFESLRDMNILFSDGKEWCPAELFEYFREQGLIYGKFKRTSWVNPTEFLIKEM